MKKNKVYVKDILAETEDSYSEAPVFKAVLLFKGMSLEKGNPSVGFTSPGTKMVIFFNAASIVDKIKKLDLQEGDDVVVSYKPVKQRRFHGRDDKPEVVKLFAIDIKENEEDDIPLYKAKYIGRSESKDIRLHRFTFDFDSAVKDKKTTLTLRVSYRDAVPLINNKKLEEGKEFMVKVIPGRDCEYFEENTGETFMHEDPKTGGYRYFNILALDDIIEG